MGCDIHIVTEIRKNGKWQSIEERPESMTRRDYGLFAVLADVCNYFNYKHFQTKGLPDDMSSKKFYFKSSIPWAKKSYETKSRLMFVTADGKYKDVHRADCLKVITEEEYERLSGINKDIDQLVVEDKEAFEKRYSTLGRSWKSGKGTEYSVYDATLQNGTFEQIPLNKIYESFDDFLKNEYDDEWDEDAQDYGKWEVNFNFCDCGDYHTPSYLSLKELEEFDYSDYQSHRFKIDKDLSDAFVKLGGKLPNGMNFVNNTVPNNFVDAIREGLCPTVVLSVKMDKEDADKLALMKGIKELQEIASQYGVCSDDIRIIFAFDN